MDASRSRSETGSYLRLIDFVYHSTLGLRVIKKKKKNQFLWMPRESSLQVAGGSQGPEFRAPGFGRERERELKRECVRESLSVRARERARERERERKTDRHRKREK